MALYAGIGVGVAVVAATVAFFVYRSRHRAAAPAGAPSGKPSSKENKTADMDTEVGKPSGDGSLDQLPNNGAPSHPLPTPQPKAASSGMAQGGKAPPTLSPALDSMLATSTSGSAAPTLPSMLPFTLTVDDSQAGLPGQGPAR